MGNAALELGSSHQNVNFLFAIPSEGEGHSIKFLAVPRKGPKRVQEPLGTPRAAAGGIMYLDRDQEHEIAIVEERCRILKLF